LDTKQSYSAGLMRTNYPGCLIFKQNGILMTAALRLQSGRGCYTMKKVKIG